ncbi:MAG: ATP-binding cassette domain-containing protein [bacterium]|nr:ATP-binding cassette domain-containing protein [bacterium]
METVISVDKFSKRFGRQEVVHDLSFEVRRGEVFAFLGANGSGKTTTVRCLLGLMRPSAGELLIQGRRYDETIASRIGYLPEERGLYTSSNVLETMTYVGSLKGVAKNEAIQWSERFLERVGLADKAKEKVKRLSSGQQQKIQLGLTLINNPEILILDEPTKGLDPVNRALFMEMLEERRAHGATIMFITHLMDEVEKIADRLIMIHQGRRRLYGEVGEVRRQFGENRIHVDFSGTLPEAKDLFRSSVDGHRAELIPLDGVTSERILEHLVSRKLKMQKFEIDAPSLQEIFVMISESNE